MPTRRILIVYGSSYGQTEKIARRLRDDFMRRRYVVQLVDAKAGPLDVSSGAFDTIVVGASIIARGHQPAVERFIRDNAALLNSTPSAFYSVSASAGSSVPESRAAAERLREQFLQSVGWRPARVASIAGAINYTRYNRFLRWYMKLASRRNGGSTDTSRDHEYTDWTQVERFAGECAAIAEGAMKAASDRDIASASHR
jgi:menaquinone-dependent protoporphyrinogen oxidase